MSLRGEVIADGGIGEARRGVAMAADSVVAWFSNSKPVGAVALAQLREAGRLDLDDPVVAYVPEFAQQGKGAVTIRHLLTHTGGFLRNWSSSPEYNWDEAVAAVCAVPLEEGWVPGRRAGYHNMSSRFIVGEIVRRLDGRPYERYVREAIFQPIGMADSWIGMPRERHAAYGDRIAIMHQAADGALRPMGRLDSVEGAARCVPGAGERGPMRDLGRFYELLLGRGRLGEVRLLSPQAVEALTTPARVGMRDETLGHRKDWGLGFALDTHRISGPKLPASFGPHASPRAFGHGGFRSSLAFADPAHGLEAAIATNGVPSAEPHQRRFGAITAALYEDLGPVPG